jgi:translation initiation factor IF-3
MAREAGLDLVEVAPNADPPVCRIMDFGKFLYEKTKKSARRARLKQKLRSKKFACALRPMFTIVLSKFEMLAVGWKME